MNARAGRPVIEVSGLRKVYEPSPRWLRVLLKSAINEPVVALDDISFSVDAGQICAIVGPNGAGKSTLFRVLTGLTTPTEGSASIGGHDCDRDAVAVRRMVGFMPPEDRTLFLRHDCVENLRFHARMQGLPSRELDARIDETLELVDLGHARHRAGFALSSGMRSRLQLACAVIHRPAALILDEPTGAVDPIAAERFLHVVQTLAREEDMAVLISSHRLEEIEALDDNMLMIDQGRVAYWGDLDAMRQVWEQPRQRLTFGDASAAASAIPTLEAAGFEVTRHGELELSMPTDDSFGKVIAALGASSADLRSVAESRLSLRELLGKLLEANRGDDTKTPAA